MMVKLHIALYSKSEIDYFQTEAHFVPGTICVLDKLDNFSGSKPKKILCFRYETQKMVGLNLVFSFNLKQNK